MNNDFRNDYSDYLMHYGVKGMKWHDHHYVVPGAKNIGGKKKDPNRSSNLKRESQVRDLVNYNKENNRQSDGYMDTTNYLFAARDVRDYGHAQDPQHSHYSGTRSVSDEQAREKAAQILEELAEKRNRATMHTNYTRRKSSQKGKNR